MERGAPSHLDSGSSAAPPEAARPGRRRKRLAVGAAVLVVLLAAYAAGSFYTRRPAFCNTCHEMSPYYAAWQTGAHADVPCVDCHVDPGPIADLLHKPYALHEVWIHFTGDPTFPKPSVDLPNARCLRCHDDVIDPGITDFDHEEHRGGRTCKTCHDATGHLVTATALSDAGILNADVQAQRDARRGIVVGNGTPLLGHVAVPCSNCHDMPASTCTACHEPPEEHPERPCQTCHTLASWEFAHPDTSATCVLCHARPTGHRDGECSLCHAPGDSWDFVHPSATDCAACHNPPANHYAGSCASCHTPGTPFSETVFSHPGQTASCSDCHSAPSGHQPGQCSACHAPGAAWAFAHPQSNACAYCHSAPAGHYGSACANCHALGRAWASANFSHPGIPGGEHTYRSFECANCHPNGYSSATCTRCHEGGAPEEEEDDD